MTNLTSRTLTGGAMIALGLILIVVSPFVMFASLIYGIPILIIGVVIFFNTKEDEVEKIKSRRKK